MESSILVAQQLFPLFPFFSEEVYQELCGLKALGSWMVAFRKWITFPELSRVTQSNCCDNYASERTALSGTTKMLDLTR